MKKIKITESDLKIASASEVKKIFAEAGKSKEGKKAYADEMELFYFMEKIQKELKRRHLTKYAFAKNAGMNPFVLSRAMTNIEDAKYKTLKKMANGLGKGLRLELYDLPKHT